MIKAVLRGKEFAFETKAGLFSREHVDTGSKLLIEALEIKPDDTILDIGCGYGPIGLAAAYAAPRGKVFMVDVDIRAIKISKKNAITNQIHNVFILPSDGFEDVPADVPLNLVVSNPPSHTPKETVLQFISDAHRQLVKGGRLYFVTERRIKPMIQREFEKIFGNYSIAASDSEFIVSLAIK